MNQYRLGDTVSGTATYRKADGSLVDATSPRVVIHPPSGSDVTVAMVKDSTGQYHWEWYVANNAALGAYRFVERATVEGADVESDQDQFQVVASYVAPVAVNTPGYMSLADLRECAEAYLSAWSVLAVRDEILTPMDKTGVSFTSFWDNWVIPPNPDGIEPLVTVNGVAQQRIIPPATTGDYALVESGDSVRAKLTFTTVLGADAIVLATYRRTLFRDTFWQSTLLRATKHVYSRLLLAPPDLSDGILLANTEPWHLVVMDAARTALVNLQTMLAGFGKMQVEGVISDLSRAHNMVHDVINDISEAMDRDVIAWRWKNSARPRAAAMSLMSVPGPGMIEVSYAG